MKLLEIESDGNYIDVIFNDYTSIIGYDRVTFNKSTFTNMSKGDGIEYIRIDMSSRNFSSFNLSFSQVEDCFVVSSVNGVTPTDLNDLYDKIKDLM